MDHDGTNLHIWNTSSEKEAKLDAFESRLGAENWVLSIVEHDGPGPLLIANIVRDWQPHMEFFSPEK